MPDVSLVNSGSPTKPLGQFMMNNRVEPPVSASAPGRPGDWAMDDEKVYFCIAPDDWCAFALVRFSSDSVSAAPAESDQDDNDGADHEADADADASSEPVSSETPAAE